MTCTFGRCSDSAVAVLDPCGDSLPRCHWHLSMTTGGVRHVGVYADGTVRMGEVLLARGTTADGRRVLPSRRNVAAGSGCRILWLTTRVLA